MTDVNLTLNASISQQQTGKILEEINNLSAKMNQVTTTIEALEEENLKIIIQSDNSNDEMLVTVEDA